MNLSGKHLMIYFLLFFIKRNIIELKFIDFDNEIVKKKQHYFVGC